MRILITGATGMLGKKLLEKIKPLGHALFVLIRHHQHGYQDARVAYVVGDVMNLESLYLATSHIDVVIHLAGITRSHNQNHYYQINTIGTKNLVNACNTNQVKKLIYISSRVAETDCGAYGYSKLLAEQEIERSPIDWIIFRVAEVYGAGSEEIISRLLTIIKKSYIVPVVGDGQFLVSPLYVDDCVDCIISSLGNSVIHKRRYVLSGPEEFTYLEMVNRIIKMMAVRRIKIFLPLPLIAAAAFIFSLLRINFFVLDQIPRLLCKKSSDISLAKKDFNFSPRSLELGLRNIL